MIDGELEDFEKLTLEGSDAYQMGMDIESNPYEYFSWEAERWNRGYMNAKLGEANELVA